MTKPFKPNAALFDAYGALTGFFLRERSGLFAIYTDEDVWENGGSPIRHEEIAAWDWSVVEGPAFVALYQASERLAAAEKALADAKSGRSILNEAERIMRAVGADVVVELGHDNGRRVEVRYEFGEVSCGSSLADAVANVGRSSL